MMRRTKTITLPALLILALYHADCCSLATAFQIAPGDGNRRIRSMMVSRGIPASHRWERIRTSSALPRLFMAATDDESEEKPKSKKKPKKRSKQRKSPPSKKQKQESTRKSKEDLVKAVGAQMKEKRGVSDTRSTTTTDAKNQNQQSQQQQQSSQQPSEAGLLDRINPFKAGQNLRKTIDTALTSIQQPLSDAKTSKYYLDDRFLENTGGGAASVASDPRKYLEQEAYIPEVLVVGAASEIGVLVVRQLVRSGRFRVRVLVRDLYTNTLNALGTSVTYCQGDLSNVDSLEYAVTDIDKLVFCAAPPRADEDDFQSKFEEFMKENLKTATTTTASSNSGTTTTDDGDADLEWEQLESVLEVRARLAETVDLIGMQNLVRAYQDVRHADYGTSQAAKRSLFKFQDRPEDFNLFAIDQGDDDEDEDDNESDDEDETQSHTAVKDDGKNTIEYDDEEDESDEYEDYEDTYADYDDGFGVDEDSYSSYGDVEKRSGEAVVQTQSQWIRNKFEHGVFVGRIPQSTLSVVSGEAAIVSSRLRSREDPEKGIELGPGFAGFICRVCSDGGTYEAFVRTGAYYDDGIEYVCEFSTSAKPTGRNKSRNKFITVRLPFENFKPVRRKMSKNSDGDDDAIPQFRGRDVRNIGFRYRSASNAQKSKIDKKGDEWNRFYLALSYIKLYRSQPEPEFVYLSDARIPPIVQDGMVRHGAKQLVHLTTTQSADGSGSAGEEIRLLDESTLKSVEEGDKSRSPEETYYKYRGEEILKKSGLSYSIVRVSGFNESPSGEASTIELKSSVDNDEEIAPVSRADIAKICVSALLEPEALNKSFYITKKKGSADSKDEDITAKFADLPIDTIR